MISKSTYVAGMQCDKLLWNLVNRREEMPGVNEATQAIFDQGHEVGALAKKLFPNGIEVAVGIVSRQAVIEHTAKLLRMRKPLFEAAVTFAGTYARADILNPVGTEEWELVEVKSATTLKEVFLQEIALQRHVFAGAGLNISRCRVMVVNNAYVREGAVDPKTFFTTVDVTHAVSVLLPTVPLNLARMTTVIATETEPSTKIGPHCTSPYGCALQDRCWSFLPEGNVLELYRGKAKSFDLLSRGVTRLADIGDDVALTTAQHRQRQVATSGKRYVDGVAIQRFLASLRYPLYLLDFETFMSAIPVFDGVRPFQQLPFQFSLHVVTGPDSEPVHHDFLAEGTADPRRAFMDALVPLLCEQGSIVVYNGSFEKTRLRECCACFPELQPWLDRITHRFVDLLKPFQGFALYDGKQRGSASIKAVLPALVEGHSYGALEIQNGGQASREYLRVTFGNVSPVERQRVRDALQRYCGLDTSAMWHILQRLIAHTS